MKKINLILVLLLTSCLCFTGCLSDTDITNNSTPTKTIEESAEITDVPAEENSEEIEEDNETSAHTHEFSSATCTEPETCTLCGAANGDAAGHNWSAATCTSPKTCTSCGSTGGDAVGHNWSAATCTSPKTCTSCGTTDGDAAGHDWSAATCTSPKTCTSCGSTDGNTADHNYISRKCSFCGASDPSYSNSQMVWIPKTGSKYHSNSKCSNMKNPSQVTVDQAIRAGYEPCKKCY